MKLRLPKYAKAVAVTATVAVALAAGAGVAGAAATSPTAEAIQTNGSAPQPHNAHPRSVVLTHFSDNCIYSHEANDDPILKPGQNGVSMAHDFFGNTGTNASSTATKLVGGSTSCSTSADDSAYWTPVLSQNGRAITPIRDGIYWTMPRQSGSADHTMPAGIQIIAGNEKATAPQGISVVYWSCATPHVSSTATRSPIPIACSKGSDLRLTIAFPSCWDGTTLSGAAQTNVVYPENKTCPASHPVRIPGLVFHVYYPVISAQGLTLSMGPGMQGSTNTAHGDFINGWNEADLTRVVNTCASAARKPCGPVRGAAATLRPTSTTSRHSPKPRPTTSATPDPSSI